MVAQTLEAFGRVDILVNNAATFQVALIPSRPDKRDGKDKFLTIHVRSMRR